MTEHAKLTRNAGGAYYVMEMRIECVGQAPPKFNPAASELTGVTAAAAAAARRVVEDAGYTIASAGSGSRRLDLSRHIAHGQILRDEDS